MDGCLGRGEGAPVSRTRLICFIAARRVTSDARAASRCSDCEAARRRSSSRSFFAAIARSEYEGPDQSILASRHRRKATGVSKVSAAGQFHPRAFVSSLRALAISRPVQRSTSMEWALRASHTDPMCRTSFKQGTYLNRSPAALWRAIGRGSRFAADPRLSCARARVVLYFLTEVQELKLQARDWGPRSEVCG